MPQPVARESCDRERELTVCKKRRQSVAIKRSQQAFASRAPTSVHVCKIRGVELDSNDGALKVFPREIRDGAARMLRIEGSVGAVRGSDARPDIELGGMPLGTVGKFVITGRPGWSGPLPSVPGRAE